MNKPQYFKIENNRAYVNFYDAEGSIEILPILGADMFSDAILKFDMNIGMVYISSNIDELKDDRTYNCVNFDNCYDHVVFKGILNDWGVRVLLDTGFGGNHMLLSGGHAWMRNGSHGILTVGNFSYSSAIVTNDHLSDRYQMIVGVDFFLKAGSLIIDYRENKLYLPALRSMKTERSKDRR